MTTTKTRKPSHSLTPEDRIAALDDAERVDADRLTEIDRALDDIRGGGHGDPEPLFRERAEILSRGSARAASREVFAEAAVVARREAEREELAEAIAAVEKRVRTAAPAVRTALDALQQAAEEMMRAEGELRRMESRRAVFSHAHHCEAPPITSFSTLSGLPAGAVPAVHGILGRLSPKPR